MAFTADELANIQNSTLEHYIDKGKVWAQNVANKPLLRELNSRAGRFPGGKEVVSVAVKSGQGGGQLQGYSGDDQVGYYNPTGTKRARFPWKEHHMGTVITHTELKTDGIDVIEDGADARTREMSGREEQVLANLLDEKNDALGEDYAYSLDRLLHGDGSTDAKAIAGIKSLILDNPAVGATGGLSRVAHPWWRNRAYTAAHLAGGGDGPITSNVADGGALIQFLQAEERRRTKFANGGSKIIRIAGSDFIGAYEKELRANGNYTMNGWGDGKADGAMGDVSFNKVPFIYDPTMDEIGESKRMYAIDVGRTGIRLLYMDGQRMKKHRPARPYDRYVMYNGITMTGVLMAKQLNTSGVYDIA